MTKGTGQFTLNAVPLDGVIAGATLMLWLIMALGFGSLDTLAIVTRRSPRRRRSTPVASEAPRASVLISADVENGANSHEENS